MSSFICEKCGKEILDTESGYITECEHYPKDKKLICPICKRNIHLQISYLYKDFDDKPYKRIVKFKCSDNCIMNGMTKEIMLS